MRKLSVIIIFLLTFFLLFSCGPKVEDSAQVAELKKQNAALQAEIDELKNKIAELEIVIAEAKPITINWWHAMRGARGKVVDNMIKAFND